MYLSDEITLFLIAFVKVLRPAEISSVVERVSLRNLLLLHLTEQSWVGIIDFFEYV
jgi:hypothetical protein